MLNNKKIFITGHTGFKGSWLCKLLKEKYDVQLFGYSLKKQCNKLYDILNIKNIMDKDFISNDILDFSSLNQIIENIQPDIIFHLAAQPLVRDSYLNPLDTFNINAIGTANLLETIRLNMIKKLCAVICITTDKVYANDETEYAFTENDKLGGHDPYSSSKTCAEIIIESYRKSYFNPKQYGITHNIQLASVRAGNVIGPGDFSKDRIVPDIFNAIKNKKPICLRNPQSIRPWQHVIEPLTGYIRLAEKMIEKPLDTDIWSSAWNFGPDEESFETVEYLTKNAIKILKAGKYKDVHDINNVYEANVLKLDSTKAKLLLQWKSKWSLDKSIKKTFEWYKAYLNKATKLELRENIENQIREYNEKD